MKAKIAAAAVIATLAIGLFSGKAIVAEDENRLFIPFSATPSLPKNQVQGTDSYFNLNVGDEESQTVYVQIKNDKSRPISIRAQAANALTSPAGNIQYSTESQTDESWLIDRDFEMKPLISIQPRISVDAGKTASVPIEVKMPKGKTGTYLGGVIFSAEEAAVQKKENPPKQSGMVFETDHQAAVAIAIQINHSQFEAPAFRIGEAGISKIPSGIQAFADFKNEGAAILKNVKGDYQVKDKSGNVVFLGTIGPFDMAPKSEIKYAFFWNGDAITAEDYKISLEGEADGKHFANENKVSVSKNFVEELKNASASNEGRTPNNKRIWIAGGAVAAVVAIVAGVCAVARRKREMSLQKEEKGYTDGDK